MRILLVDDHTLFLEALAGAVLEAEFDNPAVVSAATAAEAEHLLALHGSFDLALVDLDLRSGGDHAGAGGLDIIELVRERSPATPVVVVTGSEAARHVREAWALGARGYLPKTVSAHEMRHALRAVLEGGQYLPAQLIAHVTPMPAGAAPADDVPALTGRQHEVLRLIAEGLANKEIARTLAVTEGTVKLHVHDLLQRLGCRNRTEAVTRARALGLLA